MNRKYILLLLIFVLVDMTNNALANNEEPELGSTFKSDKKDKQWEFGFGVGSLNVAHYIGANQHRKIAIPIPYVKYQGDFIKADRRGVRGVFFKDGNLEINLSFNLSLPVDSEDNIARTNMPDIGLGIELGPALEFTLIENSKTNDSLVFKWPVRAAFEIGEQKLNHYGWISSPRLQYQRNFTSWKWRSYISMSLANKDYQSFFYDVKTEYITENREFYSSDAGFLNLATGFSLSQRVNNWFFGGFINYVDLKLSKNLESPLVKRKSNINFGFFLIRTL